jgi:hypothetical protein
LLRDDFGDAAVSRKTAPPIRRGLTANPPTRQQPKTRRWRFGWLGLLVSTPAFHHWHQGAAANLLSERGLWVAKSARTYKTCRIESQNARQTRIVPFRAALRFRQQLYLLRVSQGPANRTRFAQGLDLRSHLELHQVLWSAIIWSGTEDPVKRTFWSSSMLGDFAPRSANTELAGSGDVLRPATASCRRLRVRWGFLNSYAADTTASAALPSHGASTSASCPESPPHSKAGLFR